MNISSGSWHSIWSGEMSIWIEWGCQVTLRLTGTSLLPLPRVSGYEVSVATKSDPLLSNLGSSDATFHLMWIIMAQVRPMVLIPMPAV